MEMGGIENASMVGQRITGAPLQQRFGAVGNDFKGFQFICSSLITEVSLLFFKVSDYTYEARFILYFICEKFNWENSQ